MVCARRGCRAHRRRRRRHCRSLCLGSHRQAARVGDSKASRISVGRPHVIRRRSELASRIMLERLRELDGENTFATIPPTPGPGGTDPLGLTPLELNDRLAAFVSPAAGPPQPLLRCAAANGRSWEFSATTQNGGSWPSAAEARSRPVAASRTLGKRTFVDFTERPTRAGNFARATPLTRFHD